MTYLNKPLGEPVRPHESYVAGVVKAAFAPMLSDRLTASRECDAEIAVALGMYPGWTNRRDGSFVGTQVVKQCYHYTTSLDAAASLYLDKPTMIPSDPLECCRDALKQRGL